MECTVRDVGNMLTILGTSVGEDVLVQHFHPKSLDPGEPIPDEVGQTLTTYNYYWVYNVYPMRWVRP